MNQPLGKRHLSFGEPEAVLLGGHRVGAPLQVGPDHVEKSLGCSISQVILRLQGSKNQHTAEK
jgi:hypothetical protein